MRAMWRTRVVRNVEDDLVALRTPATGLLSSHHRPAAATASARGAAALCTGSEEGEESATVLASRTVLPRVLAPVLPDRLCGTHLLDALASRPLVPAERAAPFGHPPVDGGRLSVVWTLCAVASDVVLL